jgi:hypothetical protein
VPHLDVLQITQVHRLEFKGVQMGTLEFVCVLLGRLKCALARVSIRPADDDKNIGVGASTTLVPRVHVNLVISAA